MQYGKAFKTIRLIKDIREAEAAEALGIDKRTLYDIESGKTALISERFGQMLHLYQVTHDVIFYLADESSNLDKKIINDINNVERYNFLPDLSNRDKEIELLHNTIDLLKEQDKFHKMEIERLLKVIDHLTKK
jgi:transcriptional regulator with XRE-family HTH domain